MGRPKGSKNRKKSNGKSQAGTPSVTTTPETTDVQAGKEQEQGETEVAPGEGVVGEGTQEDPATNPALNPNEQKGTSAEQTGPADEQSPLDEHKSEPASKPVGDDLVKRLDEMNANIRSLWHLSLIHI